MTRAWRRSAGLALFAALACGRDDAARDGDARTGSPAAGSGAIAAGSGMTSVEGTGDSGGAASSSEDNEVDLGRAGTDDPRMARGGNAEVRHRDAGAVDGGTTPDCLEFVDPVVVGTLEPAELDQLSGLVASRAHEGVLFAHEDSTGAPIVYALDTAGRALAAFTLQGAPSTDWEDIALGPGPGGARELFVGDIGDNPVRTGGRARAEIAVIRLPEPDVALGQGFVEETLSDFDVLRFAYPSGVHEAETLMVHPLTGDLLIVTRSTSGDSRVYQAAGSTPPDTLTVLTEVGRLSFDASGQGALATAGDISPTGDRVLIRTYTNVYLWTALPGESLASSFERAPVIQPWADEPQGEALSFTADGRAWLSAGEQSPAIYRADAACGGAPASASPSR